MATCSVSHRFLKIFKFNEDLKNFNLNPNVIDMIKSVYLHVLIMTHSPV